jgi:hypothetical protein
MSGLNGTRRAARLRNGIPIAAQAFFLPSMLFYHCADRDSGHWGTVGTILAERNVSVVRRVHEGESK